MRPLAALFTALLVAACDVGTLPKDPTTAPPSWPEVDPDTDPAFFAAAGGSSCANAIENTKRLGCGFEADDPAKWCATLPPKQVACMTSAKACLALRQCTEAGK
jgi:hypothetical protein